MIKLCNEIEPNNYIFLDTHSWVLYKQGRFKEADNLNDKAIKYGGDGQAIVWEHKGDIWYKLGQKDKALLHWKNAKTLSKSGGEVSPNLNQKIKKEMLIE
jgi:tetratricopeptide (TPR) repeat protein